MGDHQDIDHSGLTGVGDVAAHEADTTAVHGIADTSTLYKAGGTDVAVADGGTGSSTAAAARTALGAAAATDVTDHTGDASDAHDASAISFDDTGLTITAADVQTGLEELDAAISAGGIPATIVDAKGDGIFASAADTVVRVAAGSDGQGLIYRAAATAGIEPVEILPWTIDINPIMTPITSTNWATIGTDEAQWADQTKQSSGAQNAEIGWDIVLAQGTWTVEVLHVKFTNRGIYSVQFDAVEKGTFDGYNASAAYNQSGSVASIAVATSGKVRLTLKMATKNASSSSYIGDISWVQLRRTA